MPALFFTFLASLSLSLAIYSYTDSILISILVASLLQPPLYFLLRFFHTYEAAPIIDNEIKDLESFMALVATKLQQGLSIEASFHKACLEHEGELKGLLKEMDEKLMNGAPLTSILPIFFFSLLKVS